MTTRVAKRLSRLLAIPAVLLTVAISLAHPGHEDALTAAQAIAVGKAAIRRMVEAGEPLDGEMLGDSWIEFNGRGYCEATPVYYLIRLNNYSDGKTVYVLLDHEGRFRRARFDDGFAELRFTSFPKFPCER